MLFDLDAVWEAVQPVGWPECRCAAWLAECRCAAWLARVQMHRRSLSGTHHPSGGPPNTFAHDASARGPVVEAGNKRGRVA